MCVYNYCSVHPVFPRILPCSLHIMFFKISKFKTDICFLILMLGKGYFDNCFSKCGNDFTLGYFEPVLKSLFYRILKSDKNTNNTETIYHTKQYFNTVLLFYSLPSTSMSTRSKKCKIKWPFFVFLLLLFYINIFIYTLCT